METKDILLELRKKRNLSQDEMAEKLFVTRQAVSRWENGETMPNIDTLKMIAKTFSMSVGSLLGLEENKLCLFKQDDFTFCYRVAGILVKDNKVLLQKPNNTNEYTFPGGVVAIGEKTTDALVRRWHEETGLEINIGELRWIEENLFLLDGKPFQQVCLDYAVNLKGNNSIEDGFAAYTYAKNDENGICFYWIPLNEVKNLMVYPKNAAELLLRLDEPLQHISYLENRI